MPILNAPRGSANMSSRINLRSAILCTLRRQDGCLESKRNISSRNRSRHSWTRRAMHAEQLEERRLLAITDPFDLGTLNGTNGFQINGGSQDDFSGFSVSSAGDVNGDGIDDILIGADGSDVGGTNSGAAYVVYGKSAGFTTPIALSGLSDPDGFAINGDGVDFGAGFSVSRAGNLNSDNHSTTSLDLGDLVIAAPGANSDNGRIYVVYGQETFPLDVDLGDLLQAPGNAAGYYIDGVAGSRAGVAVSAAGDVNDDGIDDFLIGADSADPGGRTDAGQAYVVFGSGASPPTVSGLGGLTGTNGFAMNGVSSADTAGISVGDAGDVNGDGFDDVIVGSYFANGGGSSSGEAYVVFGRSTGSPFPAELELSGLDGSDGFAIHGSAPEGQFGRSVGRAGDMNGDGFDDVILGAYYAPGEATSAGEAYVVFGRDGGSSPFSSVLNVSDLDGSNGFAIHGETDFDSTGFSVSAAGDLNGDGTDDVMVGAPDRTGSNGSVYVVMGKNTPFAPIVNLSTLTVPDGFELTGIAGGDQAGFSVAALGDVNDDGGNDIIIGAPFASPAGESYVYYGEAKTEIDVEGNGQSIADGDVTPDLSDHTDFGSIGLGTGPIPRTFTIRNLGTQVLNLSGSPHVDFVGGSLADFSVPIQPSSTIAAGAEATFEISFDPSATGVRSTTVSIANDDADENPYTFVIQGTVTDGPEIDVQGNGISIADGDTSPDVSDNTEFGSVAVGDPPVDHTFTIENLGNQLLTFGPTVTVTGPNAADFLPVTTQPASSSIASGAPGEPFVISFSPTGPGLREASVTFTNNDADESPYNFAIQGIGLAPEIDLLGNGLSIVNGDATPDLADHTDFGSPLVTGGSVVRTFTIENIGNVDLNLSGAPLVDVSGTHAGDFLVTASPATTIGGGSSDTFDITFTPGGAGLRSATVTIENDDADEAPYTFSIQGTDLEPEMEVVGGGLAIADGRCDAEPLGSDRFRQLTCWRTRSAHLYDPKRRQWKP